METNRVLLVRRTVNLIAFTGRFFSVFFCFVFAIIFVLLKSQCPLKCLQPCAPCAEQCAWQCPHLGRCLLPCGAPCSRLPCNLRCDKKLKCGHRCPSLCGEVCPSSAYCVESNCNDAKKRHECVSFTDLEMTLAENPCDSDPVVVLKCSHVFAVSELDNWLGLQLVYEKESNGTGWMGCLPLNAGVLDPPRACPLCKVPIREIFRYGRLLAKSALESVNKKYLPYVEGRQMRLDSEIEHASSVERLKRLVKDAEKLQRETKDGGPAKKVTSAALHFLGGDVVRLASLGIPAHHPWPRLRSDLVLAKALFKLAMAEKKRF